MSSAEQAVIGDWRITHMIQWDTDYVGMDGPAYLRIRENGMGDFQFGLVHGELMARIRRVDDVVRVDFEWEGADENDPASGHGWLKIRGDQAEGCFCFNDGDDSDFAAVHARGR